MKIIGFLILILFSGCNSQAPKLSPISNIANGLYISTINAQFTDTNVPISIPFQITDPDTLLTCETSVSITRDNTGLFTDANMSLSGTAPNCFFNLTPSTAQIGLANFTLTVTDGTSTSSSGFSVTVSAQLPPAVADVGTAILFNEDTAHTFTLNYTDLNGDLATSCSITAPGLATITTPCACNAAGICTVTIQGNSNANGAGQFIFQVMDNDGWSNTATMNYAILPVNDAPTFPAISDISIVTNSVTTYEVDFIPDDVDLDSIDCTSSVVVTNSNTNVVSAIAKSVFAGCRLTLTLVPNAIGSTLINVTLSDGLLSSSDSFTFTLRGWGQEAYIKASNPTAYDLFGSGIAIDGDTLVVGAPKESGSITGVTNGTTSEGETGSFFYGAAYVFRRTGSSWIQEAYLKADSHTVDDNFGSAVAISQNLIAVGMPNEDSTQTTITTSGSSNNTTSDSGAVYIFSRTGATWTREAFIKADLNAISNNFGSALSLSHETLAVGVPGDDFGNTTITGTGAIIQSGFNSNSGATYIYRRSSSGTWTREAYLKPGAYLNTNDENGKTISLEGNMLAVGAPGEDGNQTTVTVTGPIDNLSTDSGAVLIYTRSGSTWSQNAFIKAPNNNTEDFFGSSVSLSNNRVAIGAPYEDSNVTGISASASSDNSTIESGAVYVFKRVTGVWSLESFIKYGVAQSPLQFGRSVSLKGDTLVVGVSTDDFATSRIVNGTMTFPGPSSNNSGSALVYHFNGSTWVEDAYLRAINYGFNDAFGHQVAISGDTIAVSALYEDSNQNSISNSAQASADNTSPDSGAVYIFRNNARLFEVTEVSATSTDGEIFLVWRNPGGTTSDFVIKFIGGTSDPGTCNRGTDIVTTSTTTSVTGLIPNGNYTFRICSGDGTNLTAGKVITVRTQNLGVFTPTPAEPGNL